jgi:hypothetical protein
VTRFQPHRRLETFSSFFLLLEESFFTAFDQRQTSLVVACAANAIRSLILSKCLVALNDGVFVDGGRQTMIPVIPVASTSS